MFGDLNDWNIYVNNQNNNFDDNSSGQGSEFSYDDVNPTQGDVASFEQSQSDVAGEQVNVQGGEDFLADLQNDVNSYDSQSLSGVGEQEFGPDAQFEQQMQQPAQKKSSSGFLLLILFLLVAGGGGYFAYQKFIAQPAASEEQATGDYFYDQATANSPQVATPQQSAEQTATIDVNLAENTQAQDVQKTADTPKDEEAVKNLSPLEKAKLKMSEDAKKEKHFSSVTIPVISGGRVDPFLPYGSTHVTNAPKFDLIAPPMNIPEADPVVDKLMETKISGIMYEASRPSAIINIDGNDHLVHRGDSFSGYTILDITKDTVVIKYSSNIYRATVGQTLDDTVNINPNSNISHQFGGAYTGGSKNVIQIK